MSRSIKLLFIFIVFVAFSASAQKKKAPAGPPPVSDSPETMYEWRNMGIVMGKTIESSEPRDGYVVLHNGTKYEGELKIRKQDGALNNFEIKTASGKEKVDAEEVAHYGYTVSEDLVKQENLTGETKNRLQEGTVFTGSGNITGEIAITATEGKPYSTRIIFKSSDGRFTEYFPGTITGFSITKKGETTHYTVTEEMFVVERYDGATYHVYLNPNPTTIREGATMLVKSAVSVGSNAAAATIVQKDAKKNGYETNMDSLITYGTKEDLIKVRDALVQLSGYNTSQEALNKSSNESLKNNLNSLELAIAGRDVADSDGGLMNVEWIVFNKATKASVIVYRSVYKEKMTPLLRRCGKFNVLSDKEQDELLKWDNFDAAVKYADECR